MYNVGEECGEMKVCKCRSLRMNAKESFFEGIVVPSALYGTETWYMGTIERGKVECSGDEVLEKYVWSNTTGLSKE